MRADLHDEAEVFVLDEQGGYWVPGVAAQDLIEEAANHEAKALELCEEKPYLGVWYHD